MKEKYNAFGEPISPQDSLKQPDTLFQKIFNILSILLLAFILLYPAIKWNQLPDRIISHWGFSGQADGWSGKSSVLFTPVISLILYIPITIIIRCPSVWNMPGKITERNKRWAYRNIKNMLVILKFLIMTNFAYLTWSSIQQKKLGAFYMILDLILIFGSMAFFIRRSTRCPAPESEEGIPRDREPF